MMSKIKEDQKLLETVQKNNDFEFDIKTNEGMEALAQAIKDKEITVPPAVKKILSQTKAFTPPPLPPRPNKPPEPNSESA